MGQCFNSLKKQKAILTLKTLNNRAPEYLRNLFIDRNTHYNRRNAGGKLNLPRSRTDHLKQSFSYGGAQLWNNLPESIRTIKSLKNFKKAIQDYFEKDSLTPTRQSCKTVFKL